MWVASRLMEWPARGVLLETGRLVLRQFTMSDADNLVGLCADPDVMRFITGGLATSRDEIIGDVLPGFMAWYGCPGGYGCWAAEEKSTGNFLGWCCDAALPARNIRNAERPYLRTSTGDRSGAANRPERRFHGCSHRMTDHAVLLTSRLRTGAALLAIEVRRRS